MNVGKVYRGDKISNTDSTQTLEIGCADRNKQIIRIAKQRGIGGAPKKDTRGSSSNDVDGERESWRLSGVLATPKPMRVWATARI